MKFGISLPSFGHLAGAGGIRQVALRAEELGYDSIWAAERLLVPDPPNQSWSRRDPTAFEPLTTLSFIAGLTERIKLCTSVIILPVRNPVLLARVSSTLDVLSNGRLELGVGVGWMREEMDVSGVKFGKRGKISDEYIELLRRVWRGEPYQGRFVEVPRHLFEPRPVKGDIPIWIGGNSDVALKRTGRVGNGWMPMGSQTPDEIAGRVDVIMGYAKARGRDDPIQVGCNHAFDRKQLSDPGGCRRIVKSYEEVGATHMIPRFENESVSDMLELMESFADSVVSG